MSWFDAVSIAVVAGVMVLYWLAPIDYFRRKTRSERLIWSALGVVAVAIILGR